MGNKIQANLHRLGVTKGWTSRWFGDKKTMQKNLQQDAKIRSIIESELPKAGVSSIDIERHPRLINVIIHTSRAGMVIGRGGSGVESLKKKVSKLIGNQVELRLTIEEVKKPNENAAIVAEGIAEQLERRTPFRRVIKQALQSVEESHGVKGVKIAVSGRLDGAEMSRSEYLTSGKIPLATLRADIDFAQKTAFTKYGTTGVKVWIYKGDVFRNQK